MQAVFAERALLPDGWSRNTRVTITHGAITSVTPQTTAAPDDTRVDALLPGLSNLHSHTFQRAMAGKTEYRSAAQDSFWTWRDLMYRFVDRLTPEQIEAIAAQAFMEMQEQGFPAVAEFHYLHHQPGGAPYADRGELSARIAAAARQTGIGLTLFPVLYAYGGTGEKPLAGGQLRFGNDLAGFVKLHERAAAAVKSLPPDCAIGIAPHSLRAVSPTLLRDALNHFGKGPVHIHCAEQIREVEEISAWLGARPVEWLMNNAGVDARWCLIHATHMTPDETCALAASEAVAGLCPVTEANLGDGFFDAVRFLQTGGHFGIGTDSNVRISLREELSTLEYGQRLLHRARNALMIGEGHTGESLYLRAAQDGARALARDTGRIEAGRIADLVAIRRTGDALLALTDDELIDGWVFAGHDGIVSDVWSAGRHTVKEGRHIARDAIAAAYRKAMHTLLGSL